LPKLFISYDIDKDDYECAFKENKIDCIIHTACTYDYYSETIHNLIYTNLSFGIKILDLCLKYKIKTFINTDTLLKRNINSYSLSKKQFVDWLKLKSNKIQVINLKVELIYGPRDRSEKFIPWVISQLMQNVEKINLTKGIQKRDFIFIEDVVSAFMVILKKTSDLPTFKEFDVGTGNIIQVKEFLEI
jgi:CDP-paratose synthetase